MFSVGQMVVCIDTEPLPGSYYAVPLEKGRIYTIREIIWAGEGLRLHDAECSPGFTGFWAWRFRPVKDTSIEIFRQIVAKPKDKVRA